jgi:hypothetical protein
LVVVADNEVVFDVKRGDGITQRRVELGSPLRQGSKIGQISHIYSQNLGNVVPASGRNEGKAMGRACFPLHER